MITIVLTETKRKNINAIFVCLIGVQYQLTIDQLTPLNTKGEEEPLKDILFKISRA